ncbi:hypothetical protein [Streptomyces sp. NPDC006551]|uniref:hypothetical protein n=1 Tax=Streptomyces sp. NPDC006551 TaxID=3157178 RepID=UPI0033BC3381
MANHDETTARRLRLLQSEFIQPGRRGPSAGRTTRPTEPAAPINLGILDYMRASVDEVEQHTRAAAPNAGPRPAEVDAIYDWYREHTAHLEPEKQLHREVVIYRQGLEHAIQMGDDKAIRRHPCPACATWGLFWNAALGKALCVNHYCTDDRGASRSWTLAYLAQQHVARQESSARRAT